MKAAQIRDYGDPSVVEIVEIDQPTTEPHQVLVEVHAASLNPFDTTVRAGYVRDSIPLELPVTLGGDFAGVVTGVGESVQGFSVGDNVYGQANAVAGNSGSFAQYLVTDGNQLAEAPTNISLQEASTLPLVGVSAQQALIDHIGLLSGQKIFIIGGSGGIGRVALQIAKNLGAYVATNATGEGIADAKALGADEVFDFKTEDFTASISNYDALFDTAGGEGFMNALKVLRSGGVAVTMIAPVDETTADQLGVQAIRQQTRVTTEALDRLRELVENDVIKPAIGKIFTLDEVSDAFTARESGDVSGKIVLDIKADQ